MAIAVDVGHDRDSHLYSLSCGAATALTRSNLARLRARQKEPHDCSLPRAPAIDPDPVDPRAHFSEAEVERGRRFSRPQLAISLGEGRRRQRRAGPGASAVRRGGCSARINEPVIGGAAAGAAMSVVLSLPSLPLAALSRRRAIKVGLVTQSWGGWAGDLLKSHADPGGARRRRGRGWGGGDAPVPEQLVGSGGGGLGGLRRSVRRDRAGRPRSDLQRLHAAARGRDSLGRARVRRRGRDQRRGGLLGRREPPDDRSERVRDRTGPTKRVVLFDTLLDRYSRDEVRVVVAHEFSHVHSRDVPRSVLFAAIVAPAGALAVQRLSWWLSDERGTPATLPALALAAGLVSAPIGLIGNRLSRAIERRADAFSLELSGAPDAFVSFERAIALQNVADLEPPKWVTTADRHPSVDDRADRGGPCLRKDAPEFAQRDETNRGRRRRPMPRGFNRCLECHAPSLPRRQDMPARARGQAPPPRRRIGRCARSPLRAPPIV